jgi:hypothetical protein
MSDTPTKAKLEVISRRLYGLFKAGLALEKAGMAPVFDLTPGREAVIHLGWVMPEVAGIGGDLRKPDDFPSVIAAARIDAALATVPPAAPLLPGDDERTPPQSANPAAAPVPPSGPRHSAAAVKPGPAVKVEAPPGRVPEAAEPPSLEQYLAAVPRDATWTLETDAELMRLALLGWPPDEIALELDVKFADVTPRFRLLTDGKRFSRDRVNDQLQVMLATWPKAAV